MSIFSAIIKFFLGEGLSTPTDVRVLMQPLAPSHTLLEANPCCTVYPTPIYPPSC